MSSTDNLRDYLRQGVTLQAVMDIDPTDMDSVYADACQRFDQRDFLGAKKRLIILTRLSHWQFEYWLALGLTCQRLNEHEEAIHSFSQSAILKMDDPQSSYLAGLSLYALGHITIAKQAFDATFKWCANKSEHQELKQRAQHMLSLC